MLKIRRYQAQDHPAVKALNQAGIAQMNPSGLLQHLPGIDDDMDDIEGVYLNHGDFIVGLEGNEIVAMGAFKRRTPECAEFKRLRIRPDCQRRGYGQTIMQKLMGLAADMGYKEAFLDTLATNTRAQRLFEKLGWEKSGGGQRGPFDLYFYTRQLNKGGE